MSFDQLKDCIVKILKEGNYQVTPHTVLKIIQLYETKNSRHSVMIVGQSQVGKSVTWRVLQNTLTRMKKNNEPGYNLIKVNTLLKFDEIHRKFLLGTFFNWTMNWKALSWQMQLNIWKKSYIEVQRVVLTSLGLPYQSKITVTWWTVWWVWFGYQRMDRWCTFKCHA